MGTSNHLVRVEVPSPWHLPSPGSASETRRKRSPLGDGGEVSPHVFGVHHITCEVSGLGGMMPIFENFSRALPCKLLEEYFQCGYFVVPMLDDNV